MYFGNYLEKSDPTDQLFDIQVIQPFLSGSSSRDTAFYSNRDRKDSQYDWGVMSGVGHLPQWEQWCQQQREQWYQTTDTVWDSIPEQGLKGPHTSNTLLPNRLLGLGLNYVKCNYDI